MAYDENKSEPITAHDTPNNTHFYPKEADEPSTEWGKEGLLSNRGYYTRKQEFEELHWINQNRGDRREKSGNQYLNQTMDRKQRFDAIASQLEFTPYQKSLGRNLRNSKSLRKMGCKDKYTSFCLCVFIARYGKYASLTPEDEHWDSETPNSISHGSRMVYHPTRSAENNDERFVVLADRLSLDNREIEKVMGRMANKLPPHLTWHGASRST